MAWVIGVPSHGRGSVPAPKISAPGQLKECQYALALHLAVLVIGPIGKLIAAGRTFETNGLDA
jgi:hypothetical protein